VPEMVLNVQSEFLAFFKKAFKALCKSYLVIKYKSKDIGVDFYLYLEIEQMSFWGATVITNLFSAIPFVGSSIVEWLWGGFSVRISAALNCEILLKNSALCGNILI
jgi:hypothetical protein